MSVGKPQQVRATVASSSRRRERRFSATPQSKTPPEQADGLTDRLDHVFEFGRHRLLWTALEGSSESAV